MRTDFWIRTTSPNQEITMVFSNELLPPMFERIIHEIHNKAQNTNKISISDLEKILITFRLTLKDTNYFIKYLQENGILERRGHTIYILDEINQEKKKPGRPSKLSVEEKQWILENYIPNEKGVRKLTEEINKKRNDDVSHMTIMRTLQI